MTQRTIYRTAIHQGMFLAALLLGLVGCKQNPLQQNPFLPATNAGTGGGAAAGSFAQTGAGAGTYQQQAATAQLQELNKRLVQLDTSNSDLHRQLAQAEQARQSALEQSTLLQKQLGEMAGKVRDSQLARQESDKQLGTIQASTRYKGGASITANNSVKQALSTVVIPGLEVHQDGEVIRIEIPADQLFNPGTTQGMPNADRIISEVAGAIGRNYPRQRIVIEGHSDGRVGPAGSPASHALTGAQAQAVLHQLVQAHRIPSRQISTMAMGDNHPLASGGTQAGQAKNRRIEVVVYPDTID